MANDSTEMPTALITGAAGNIGAAVAEAFAAKGTQLILADLDRAANGLEATQQRCEAAGAAAVILAPFDVTDIGDVRAAVTSASEELGPADFVFNNAGYQGQFGNILEADPADAQRVFDINIAGVFNVLQVCSQAMRAADKPGSIVNTASMAGVSGAPNMGAYSTSKAAVIGLTKSAAKDLAPFGIRVNSISPGFIGPGVMWDTQVAEQAAVASPYYADTPEEVAEQMVGMVPLGRYGSLEEVADAAVFLLSDAASYLTGINLEISGGAA